MQSLIVLGCCNVSFTPAKGRTQCSGFHLVFFTPLWYTGIPRAIGNTYMFGQLKKRYVIYNKSVVEFRMWYVTTDTNIPFCSLSNTCVVFANPYEHFASASSSQEAMRSRQDPVRRNKGPTAEMTFLFGQYFNLYVKWWEMISFIQIWMWCIWRYKLCTLISLPFKLMLTCQGQLWGILSCPPTIRGLLVFGLLPQILRNSFRFFKFLSLP